MLVAISIYDLAKQGIQAQSIPESTSHINPRSDLPPNGCDDLHQCRTIWNIVWSCIATIFVCTWVALHLNIPGTDETWYKIALRKLGIMMLAVIAPEIVAVWAMRQWLVAGRIAKEHKRTKTHGFFAVMGGFARLEGGAGPYTLSPEDLRSHLRKGDITEKGIKDRGKGGILSKGFVILQTGWFIVQCIARAVRGLPVTELEIVTLAIAILCYVAYRLWGNKPFDAQTPYLVHVNDREGERQVLRIVVKRNEGGWGNIFWIPFYPVLMLVEMGTGYRNDVIQPGSKRVPTFYSGKLGDAERFIAALAAVLFATTFGAIHCIAWSFQFPTHTEKLLWHISSLSVTCVPVSIFTMGGLGAILDNVFKGGWTKWLLIVVVVTVSISLAALYILARLALLVLAFMSLRSLPPAAYRTVHWTTFIPHI